MFAVPAARQGGVGLAAGYVADLAFGDPVRFHPVAGFGRLALAAERAIYAPTRARGVAYTTGLVGLAGLAGEVVARVVARACPGARAGLGRAAGLAVVAWIAVGGRSLGQIAGTLADQLDAGSLDAARATLPSLCGRDAGALDGSRLARAALESVAENTSDAVVGALLWGALAGPAGVSAYRAANTLDAMVGHRTDRYREFGWAAARLDDLLNWPAARLTAILTALCAPLVGGSPRSTWDAVRRDGSKHPSPNAGRVEAAFAGALGVRLGGRLAYAGIDEPRPVIGAGAGPNTADLRRATRLSRAVGATAAVCFAAARTALVSRRPAAVRRGGARGPARSIPPTGASRRADRPTERGQS
jgi:adenosylcobinamide-phosphate synthase